MESVDIRRIRSLREEGILTNRDRIVRTRRLAHGPVAESFDVIVRGERYVRDGEVIWVRRIGFTERLFSLVAAYFAGLRRYRERSDARSCDGG